VLDKEDEEGVVEDNFEGFQKLYRPVWKQHFADCFDITNDRVQINRKDPAVLRHLASQINDNVFKNYNRISPLLYDSDRKYSKQQLTSEDQQKIVEALIKEKDIKVELDKAVDKILGAHRNTKLFLFMMTGPFLIMVQTIKYMFKALILYYLYKKRQSKQS
jgi:hypothetical protein